MNDRSFKTAGQCVPQTDYMVDISGRVEAAKKMVDAGKYFTINRPRQYGKTTLLSALRRRLSGECVCAFISFEGLGDEEFENTAQFCKALLRKITIELKNQLELKNRPTLYDAPYVEAWGDDAVTGFSLLSEHITKMCQGKKVALLIDEVDKTSNNRVFIQFIGMLRDKFLNRIDGMGNTFQSVILAGVHDIRNLKVKLAKEGVYGPSGDEGHSYNSPWNIASPFTLDMSFSASEIAGMLREYENDHNTGMDVGGVAETIHEYSGGYPFLVSRLCQMLDEGGAGLGGWSRRGVIGAVNELLHEDNTLFDDIIKNLENYPELYSFIYGILILGERKSYTISAPIVKLAAMFGLIRDSNRSAAISNRVFEIVISDYFISKDIEKRGQVRGCYEEDVIAGGRFDMEQCMRKFAGIFRELYTEKDAPFVEEHGRMLFLTYLRPLINGAGFYHIESHLTDMRRMDLVVDYGQDQFIVELKLWYGNAAHEKAYDQLAGYLKSKGAPSGYLLTFDFRKDKNRGKKEGWVEWDGVRIFDVLL